MKIQKSISFLAVLLYIVIIFFSPASYLNQPKFLFLNIIKYPLTLATKISYNLNNLLHSREAIQQNLSLLKTIDILTGQLTQYKEIEAENRRLRKLLDFKESSPLKLKAVRIIGKDSSDFFNTILIGRGRSSGIKKDTVVISEAGLVGVVSSASSGISSVTLITDPASRLSAIVSRSREMGVVYGLSAKLCQLRYISLEADIKIGDEVVTSGFSDIYPKGLLIGEVVKIEKEPSGLSLTALVKPAADISRIEEVLCIE